MSKRWIWMVVAALLALGAVQAAPGARAAECSATGSALAQAWVDDYSPAAVGNLVNKAKSEDTGFVLRRAIQRELAHWYGYALGQAMTWADPGSEAAACLRALDRHIHGQAKARNIDDAYTTGYMGGPPTGDLALAAQPKKLVTMLSDLIQTRAGGGGGGSAPGSGPGSGGGSGGDPGGEDGFIGTWDLVDWIWLRDGKPIPNVGFNYTANGWVMEFLSDGRLIVTGSVISDLFDKPVGSTIRGAWLTGDGGRTLRLKIAGSPGLDGCAIVEHSREFLRFKCFAGNNEGVLSENLFKFQRLSR